ncbi:unnamed protein product [Discula destructiva]
MPAALFLEDHRDSWPIFRTVESTRHAFVGGTQILVAIGGWGDSGFSIAARTESSRKAFARNIARMVEATGADGVDIDWEYPGGNGEDYKQVPNSEKKWEIEAYPLLLGAIRAALGQTKLMTAAVPGLEEDMIAFTDVTVPHIMRHLDYLNVMTYDLMNRRANVTKHHSSIKGSRAALQAYRARGARPDKLNLGLGFYVKWFKTDKDDCAKATSPIGCKTLPLEDHETGADLGNAGAFSWHDQVPDKLKKSFQKAFLNTEYDYDEGATYFYDDEEGLWWSYEEGRNGDIAARVKTLMGEMNLAGVFAWGLGEDGTSFRRLAYLEDALRDDATEADDGSVPVAMLEHETEQVSFGEDTHKSVIHEQMPRKEDDMYKNTDQHHMREKDEL